jgi:GntR family transcriptional regulator
MGVRLKLNPSAGIPIYRQIMDGIRDLVAAGVLAPGERLPSIRELASELRINPASAVKAYNELRHEGLIESGQGRGTFVSRNPKVVAASREALLAEELEALLLRAEARGLSAQEVIDALAARVRARENET